MIKFLQIYDSFYVKEINTRKFSTEFYYDLIEKIFQYNPELFKVSETGKSFEGRPIKLVKIGSGKIKILLWSQMHGDESTATMAIADIFNYFSKFSNDDVSRKILSDLTLYFIPILNPDGATRHQRLTAQLIDLNRDAIALVTPEAKILKHLQNELNPDFAFNLHDQELSTVGNTNEISAMAFLAPAFDEFNSDNEVRIRAKKLAAFLTNILQVIIPGKITRYDDCYEPRAFGDKMQTWGTSTVLIESGHFKNDPEKFFIRKLNAVALLAAFEAISSENFISADITTYENLPYNSYRAYDLIIRNVIIKFPNNSTINADLGISHQVNTHFTETPILMEVGDLKPFVALKEIDGNSKTIDAEELKIESVFNWKKFFE